MDLEELGFTMRILMGGIVDFVGGGWIVVKRERSWLGREEKM